MSESTYARLSRASLAGKAVFRIWAESGESPFLHHADEAQSGFFSPHTFSHGRDRVAFATLCGSLDLDSDYASQSWVRESVFAHVRGSGDWVMSGHSHHWPRSRAPHQAQPVAATSSSTDSPWIVTYSDLDYVIHRIVRLLARDYGARIHMAVIGTSPDDQSLMSVHPLRALNAQPHLNSTERVVLHEALGFAEQSGEVLFYGRIFQESVTEDFVWTTEHKPFALPIWFRRDHTVAPMKAVDSWMDNLMWMPHKTPFSLVRMWMDDRKRQLEKARESSEGVIVYKVPASRL